MRGRALIYGTLAKDTLLTPAGEAHSVLGGSGPYAALAARLLTAEMDFMGVVGDDFPREWEEALAAKGVPMQHISHMPGQTFSWTGQYGKDMNHRTTLCTAEGVQETWRLSLPAELAACPLAVATNVTPPLQFRMLQQCTGAVFRMADFMESWIRREPEYVRKLLAMVDMALMNDSEACAYAGTDDPLEAGYALLEAGARYAIVKHGSAGSTLFHRTPGGEVRLFRCPAWPLVRPQDPTGAGDSYMGALAGHLTHCLRGGHPTWEEMKRGIASATVVAAATCEQFGMGSLFALTREEFNRRMALFREMTAWE